MRRGRLLFILIHCVLITVVFGCETLEDVLESDSSDEKSSRASDVCSKSNPSTGACVPYEAEENAAAGGCKVATTHAGFTGTGFIDFGGNGTWIEWNNIAAPVAGEYTLTFRFGNGSSGNRQASIMLNGRHTTNVPFEPTGSWKNWRTTSIKIPLRQGNNTIQIQANTGSGGPNLDHVLVVGKDLADDDDDDVSDDTYQAEDRSAASGCREAANHAGFTGSGFMDYGGNGSWIEWNNVAASTAGEYSLAFRYANGSSNDRQAEIVLNGQAVSHLSFGKTGGWRNWTEETARVMLRRGNNTIRVRANTGSGGPNLDHMTIEKGTSTRRPNVVFLLADDLGFGDLATYGHPYAKTPNLDKLAEEGTKFTRFYVSGNVCNPSRTGFMTSRNPRNYANSTDDHGFRDRITITEILKNAGYKIGHFGKWHIGPDTEPGTYGIHDIKKMGGPYSDPEGRDANIYKAAIDFIEKNQDVPFYVNVWGFATHAKVKPAASLAAKFSDVNVDRDLFGVNMQSKFDDVLSIGGNISKGMRNYLGDVHGLDNAVGLLLRKLDELGLSDNTIVVFSSDQGPAPVLLPEEKPDETSSNMLGWAGGMRGGKHDNWEGGLRVPFIIRWPGKVPAGKTNNRSLFSAYDWLPTLASIAGAKFDGSMVQGEDVTDIWKGADRSRQNPLFWWWSGNTVVQGYWKLTRESGEYELYNLAEDPAERHDLSAQYPDVTAKLAKLIQDWKATLPRDFNNSPNVFLDDPVKKAVVIGPADITKPPHPEL